METLQAKPFESNGIYAEVDGKGNPLGKSDSSEGTVDIGVEGKGERKIFWIS